MLASTRRYVLIILLLLVGIGLTWGQRLSSAARLSTDLPQASADEAGTAQGDGLPLLHVYFVDVEGWYRITPYETVVRSPYDLSGETTAAMAAALPSEIGEWHQVGSDRFVGDDPAVEFYLKQPTVALERTFQDPAGQNLALTLIGNKGEDSFLLFSHTPETCYPGRLWRIAESRMESISIDGQPMHAQYLLTEHAESGQKLMVLFWYLWDDPQRDSRDGVLSVRVNLFLPPGESKEAVLQRAWDFVRLLFPSTIPWERF